MSTYSTLKSTVLFLLLAINTPQAFAVLIEFQPADTTVTTGGSFDVDVVVSGLTAADEVVSTYDLFVGYDASIISATSVSFGRSLDDFLFPSIQFDDLGSPSLLEFGEISFLYDDELAALQSDSITLATLTFDAIATGFTELLLAPHPFFGVIDIKGRDAQILAVDAGMGGITVIDPALPVPEPNSVALFLMGLFLLSFSPRLFSFRH